MSNVDEMMMAWSAVRQRAPKNWIELLISNSDFLIVCPCAFPKRPTTLGRGCREPLDSFSIDRQRKKTANQFGWAVKMKKLSSMWRHHQHHDHCHASALTFHIARAPARSNCSKWIGINDEKNKINTLQITAPREAATVEPQMNLIKFNANLALTRESETDNQRAPVTAASTPKKVNILMNFGKEAEARDCCCGSP